jgi:hypothetical protein
VAKNIGKGKPNKKQNLRPKGVPSLNKKQKELDKFALKALTTTSEIHGIWLVRQGLRSRSEQYIAIALNRDNAIAYCRLTLTPRYCRENLKESLVLDKGDETLKVNYGNNNNQLLIKGIDFSRQETGRTNQNPLWYWVVAPVPIVKDLAFKEVKDDTTKTK